MRLTASRESSSADERGRALAVLVLVGLLVVGFGSEVHGQAGSNSGSALYSFGSTLSSTESNYTVYYSTPQVMHAGIKENMTFYVYVTLLSGWKIESQTQILQVIINTPEKQVTILRAQNNVTLFQGGRWGPFNMTFDLNDSQAGLSPGQAANATIFANLVVYEALDDPVSPFVQDAGKTLQLTTVQLVASPPGPGPSSERLLTSLGFGAGVVAVLAGIGLATRRKRES